MHISYSKNIDDIVDNSKDKITLLNIQYKIIMVRNILKILFNTGKFLKCILPSIQSKYLFTKK